MNSLILALQSWKGPGATEASFNELGFTAVAKHREFWKEVCKANGFPDDIDVFWRECAREFISSGGIKKGGRGRMIGTPGVYRSRYLDDLDRMWVERSTLSQTRYLGAVHPCVYHFATTDDIPRTRGMTLREYVEETLAAPEHFHVQHDDPVETKKDGYRCLRKAGEYFNLDAIDIKSLQPYLGREGFQVSLASGLQFRIGCDLAGGPMINTPPVQSFIYHRDCLDDFVYLGGLEYVMPGIGVYLRFSSGSEAARAIYAVVAGLTALAGSF